MEISTKIEEFGSLSDGDLFVFIHDISLCDNANDKLKKFKYVQVNEKSGLNTYLSRPNLLYQDLRKHKFNIVPKARGYCYSKAYVYRVLNANQVNG